MSTSHEPAYSEDGLPKDRYRLYHVEKARGGIALTMTAGSAIVAEDSPAAFGNLHAYRDEIVPWLRQLADECHEHGAAVMIQITHLGRRTNWNKADWLPVLAASPVREPAHRSFPKEAEDWDLARIVKAYAVAAQRMQAAGLDGIEIEAYGHLLDGFWSPATNRRTDEYGGSLDNRLRFTFEVLSAIRTAVGADFIVGIRMVADEDWERGLSRAEGLEIAQRLVAGGQVDFLNIIRGHIETDAALSKVIPIQGTPAAPHLDFAGEVRSATRFPVFHAARINDVATARHAIAAGKLDMVGMTRAHLADPHIARKVAAGLEQDIRPCVGATYCLDRIYEGHEALCIHNPATGREATMPHVIASGDGPKKKVVVVGAGPAGLEAARVAAARGHDVVLLEAADRPGGQIRLAARARRRSELIGIAEWRLAQCQKHGVDLRCNQLAEADDVLAREPGRRDRRDRRPARPRFFRTWRGPRGLELGHPLRRCQARRPRRAERRGRRGPPVRRQRRPSRPAGGRGAGRGRGEARDRDARALLRPRDRRPQPRRLRPLLQGAGRADHDQHAPASRSGARAIAWRPSSAAITAPGPSSAWSTRSWSSMAPCRWTISISRSRRAPPTAARSTTRR